MTDEEIIKALECCMKIDCQNCPAYVTNNQSCKGIQIFDVVTLINRQKAEIDKLKIENCALSEKRITFPERLKIAKHARAETIKEFAERLIRNITMNNTNDGYLDYSVDYNCLIEDINDLTKEMSESEK